MTDNSKNPDIHDGIGKGIEGCRRDAVCGERGEGDEEVASVGNRGVRQHALKIFLAQGAQIADRHGDDGQPPQ